MIKTLTDRFVAGVRPKDRLMIVSDAKARGLALRIGTRTKVWYFTYRNGGPSQWLKLGEYPALSLADARKRVNEERASLDNGVDPVEEKRKAAEPPPTPPPAEPVFTFADFVPIYVRFQKGRTRHWADEEGKIKRYLLPAWGPLPLKSITRAHVSDLLDTVQNKGLTAGTNRIQAVITHMFAIALDKGKVDAHPAARIIKRHIELPRDTTLTDDQIRALWTSLDAQPGPASDAVRLRLLLGQRGAETAGMGWNELDLDRAIWTIPRARTKTQKRPHSVALPQAALRLLKTKHEAAAPNEPRVFPDLTLTSKEHKALGGIPNGAYEWKDLRRTVATRLAELGFNNTTIGRVLNHAKVTITEKHYNQHTYVEEIRAALTAWDTELQRILANEPKSKTNVLPMRAR